MEEQTELSKVKAQRTCLYEILVRENYNTMTYIRASLALKALNKIINEIEK